jgi:cytochrome c biogenesis protein CcmG/thiol:disulfide interchange protein DsbE
VTAAAASLVRRVARVRWAGLLWPIAAAALLLAGVLMPKAGDEPPPLVGRIAPAFSLPQLGAAQRNVDSAAMLGQVWLLNVWASWCAPCRDEHPQLVALAREHGIALVGLNYRDDPRAAEEWLLRLGDPYRATAIDRDGGAALAWGVTGVPATFVVDRAGVVRYRVTGPLTHQTWTRELEPLVARLQKEPS